MLYVLIDKSIDETHLKSRWIIMDDPYSNQFRMVYLTGYRITPRLIDHHSKLGSKMPLVENQAQNHLGPYDWMDMYE